VDIDAEALGRGKASFAPDARDRVVLHAGLDLSGFAARIDEWGERFPDNVEIAQAARVAIAAILAQIGRTFEIVLSDCVLSQLAIAYKRTLIMPRPHWGTLFSSITAVHLATLTGSVAPGGRGILACDVAGANASPVLCDFRGTDGADLDAFVRAQAAAGHLQLEPDPEVIVERLTSPALKSLVEAPQVTPPWLWDTGDTLVVYGLVFRRPSLA
jgi:hypothetical protein